jgi:hypothetical protein
MAQPRLQLSQEPKFLTNPISELGVSCRRNYSEVGLSHNLLLTVTVDALRQETVPINTHSSCSDLKLRTAIDHFIIHS